MYDPKNDIQYQVVTGHLNVIKTAVLLSQSIDRLGKLGELAADRVKKDKKSAMISQVLAAGLSYKKAVDDYNKLKDDNAPTEQDLLLVQRVACLLLLLAVA